MHRRRTDNMFASEWETPREGIRNSRERPKTNHRTAVRITSFQFTRPATREFRYTVNELNVASATDPAAMISHT